MSNKLTFDNDFFKFIIDNSDMSKIANMISRGNFIKYVGDFIKKDEGNDTISFIPKSKLGLDHNGLDDTKYRIKLKIGRFVTKFISKDGISYYNITQTDVESFVNFYKSYFDRDESKLKIVDGDDILKYYLYDSYHQPNGSCIGQLWNSCMRYREKNTFMEIYSKNPDKIKMLVLLAEDGKLKTRALLWEDCKASDGTSYKVMDRIYSIYDHDVILFKDWALKNGYIHKLEQSARTEDLFVGPNGAFRIGLTTKIENHRCENYPYIDSFKWYSRKSGTLSNSSHFPYKYILVQNDGGLMPSNELEDEVELEF